MSKEMTLRGNQLPAAWAKSMQRMEEFTEASKVAIDVASENHAYITGRVASTLTFTSLLYKAARERGLSPLEEEGYRQLTQQFLNTASTIAHLADTRIITTLAQLHLQNGHGGDGDDGWPHGSLLGR